MGNEKYEEIKKRFTGDVKDHQIKIILDDGVHRHLRFQRPESSVYHYEIITWPGYLCICGDMGTFVFSRVEDMFTFFRGDTINPSYWGEKLQSIANPGGHEEFSTQAFNDAILAAFEEWEFESDEIKAAIWRDVELSVCGVVNDGEFWAMRAAMDYRSRHDHKFEDIWECNFRVSTHRFIWCLYAIIHGIAQYDNSRGQ